MQTILEPSIFMCDSIYYYQITGDKEGFDRMIMSEVPNKIKSYFTNTLNFIIVPLFDIKHNLGYEMFSKLYEAYDSLFN